MKNSLVNKKRSIDAPDAEALFAFTIRNAMHVIPLPVGKNRKMAKIKLDLHDIYNRGLKIDAELDRVMTEAMEKRIALVEIIPGKGSGQLKKHVLRFLRKPEIKKLYHRIEKDDKKDIFNIKKELLRYYDVDDTI